MWLGWTTRVLAGQFGHEQRGACMILGDRQVRDRDGNRYTLHLSVDVQSAILNDAHSERAEQLLGQLMEQH